MLNLGLDGVQFSFGGGGMDRRAAPGGDGGGGMDAGDAAAGPDDVLSRDSEVGSWVGVSHGFDVCLCFDALCIVRCAIAMALCT